MPGPEPKETGRKPRFRAGRALLSLPPEDRRASGRALPFSQLTMPGERRSTLHSQVEGNPPVTEVTCGDGSPGGTISSQAPNHGRKPDEAEDQPPLHPEDNRTLEDKT
jgi:hypothetical protein